MKPDLWDFLVQHQHLVRGDDGMWLYWPAHWDQGGLHAFDLEAIARRMRKENRASTERLAEALKS